MKYLLIIILIILCARDVNSQENVDRFQHGFQTVLDSLTKNSPKHRYSLETNNNHNLFFDQEYLNFWDCDIEYDKFKTNQSWEKVKFPNKYKSIERNFNFINRFIYGNKLKKISFTDIYVSDLSYLFSCFVYDKEGGEYILIEFNIETNEILNYCTFYVIY